MDGVNSINPNLNVSETSMFKTFRSYDVQNILIGTLLVFFFFLCFSFVFFLFVIIVIYLNPVRGFYLCCQMFSEDTEELPYIN